VIYSLDQILGLDNKSGENESYGAKMTCNLNSSKHRDWRNYQPINYWPPYRA